MKERDDGTREPADDESSRVPAGRRPAKVGGQHRDDAALNRHGRQSADDGGVAGEGAGAAELDAEIARRSSGGAQGRRGTGLGAGLTPRPPD